VFLMHPEIGKAVYGIILSLLVLLGISFIYLTPNETSFYIALAALVFLIILLLWTINDIRKQAGQEGLRPSSEPEYAFRQLT